MLWSSIPPSFTTMIFTTWSFLSPAPTPDSQLFWDPVDFIIYGNEAAGNSLFWWRRFLPLTIMSSLISFWFLLAPPPNCLRSVLLFFYYYFNAKFCESLSISRMSITLGVFLVVSPVVIIMHFWAAVSKYFMEEVADLWLSLNESLISCWSSSDVFLWCF